MGLRRRIVLVPDIRIGAASLLLRLLLTVLCKLTRRRVHQVVIVVRLLGRLKLVLVRILGLVHVIVVALVMVRMLVIRLLARCIVAHMAPLCL